MLRQDYYRAVPTLAENRPAIAGNLPQTIVMTGTFLAAVARLLSGASVRWIDCQPDTCQRVYFANHTSHLDADRALVGVAAARAGAGAARGGQGLLGTAAASGAIWPARFNALLIDRTDIKVHQSPVDLMLREIGDRYSLIVFPEGSRNTGAENRRIQERAVSIWPRNGRTWNWCPSISTI